MKKGWRIVIIIVLVALLLGAVSVGVGMMTGADSVRIFSLLNDRYNISGWYSYGQEVIQIIMTELA